MACGAHRGIFLLPRFLLLMRVGHLQTAWRLLRDIEVELAKISAERCKIGKCILIGSLMIIGVVRFRSMIGNPYLV